MFSSFKVKEKGFWICFALIFIAVSFLRFWQIDLRSFHSDEGVNFFFIQKIKELGYYPYSHENYHGPLYFYLTYFFTVLAGYSELVFRFSAIFVSLLTVSSVLIFKKAFGNVLSILLVLFLGIEATQIFYGRYAIHESLFVFGTLLWAISIIAWVVERRSYQIYLAFLGLLILVTTKETFIIALFCTSLPILTLSF